MQRTSPHLTILQLPFARQRKLVLSYRQFHSIDDRVRPSSFRFSLRTCIQAAISRSHISMHGISDKRVAGAGILSMGL
jgi:hypothetical protein